MEPNGVLLRYDEIFLKRDRRGYFLDMLDRNVRRAMRAIPGLKLRRPHGRLLLHADVARGELPPPLAEAPRMVRALSRIFGVASVSPVHIVQPDYDALKALVGQLADAWLAERPATSFAIRTRRSDKRFPANSVEVNAELGGVVLDRYPSLNVDLMHPDLRIGVEIRPEEIFVHRDSFPGPGGLPTGSNGKVMALLSGGIDSPVAAWQILRRGVQVEAVYFHSFPYTSDAAKEKVLALGRIVGQWQGGMTIHVVPFTDIQRACHEAVPSRALVLLYRRFMFRIAERLAKAAGAGALVTGESLGQVASQTLDNMDCINRVVTLPVLRPLVANDKHETIRVAQQLGTYETSIQPFDDCCSLFVPRHPELRGRPAAMERFEQALDIEGLVAAAMAGIERFEV